MGPFKHVYNICLVNVLATGVYVCHSSLYSLLIGHLLHRHELSFIRESMGVGLGGSRLDQGRDTSKREYQRKKQQFD